MWPEPVERIAEVLRASRADGRIEELGPDEEDLHDSVVGTTAYDCGGALLVALVPAGRVPDTDKVAALSGLTPLRTVTAPAFPYSGAARVLIERLLLGEPSLAVDLGTPRHVLVLRPAQLLRLVRAVPSDILPDV